ncbi:hypothetical protein Tsubulata_009214 [Turnera subulata]|uniref:Uncharacterized protein n=1 Tax=Turnera subulata TaxID=218843 RepID=A0A9Q0J8P2_9ROSI|nr:hypothetical protein Tsubulata_009214 [Turnera subulata]
MYHGVTSYNNNRRHGLPMYHGAGDSKVRRRGLRRMRARIRRDRRRVLRLGGRARLVRGGEQGSLSSRPSLGSVGFIEKGTEARERGRWLQRWWMATEFQKGGHNDVKFKKGKSTNGVVSKSWSFTDPELRRKRRVASYKVYSVEGKVKGSLKKSF